MDLGNSVTHRNLFSVDAQLMGRLKEKLISLPEQAWAKNKFRQENYQVHQSTNSIVLKFFLNQRNDTDQELIDFFNPEVSTIIEKSAEIYGYKTYHLASTIFARLPPGGEIPRHRDASYDYELYHRIHVPILTSENNIFEVMNQRVSMDEGNVIEINNCRKHYCINHDVQDRVHLIFDVGDVRNIKNPKHVFKRIYRNLKNR